MPEKPLSVAAERSEASFYRASGGAEIDLVLTRPGRVTRNTLPGPNCKPHLTTVGHNVSGFCWDFRITG